jgi:glutamate N-acetyltransferase/amino-acid N-acetyltransferase
VDGDTSTNDMVLALANGLAKNRPIDDSNPRDIIKFECVFTEVLGELAKMMVKDGEGATKFVTLAVCGARYKREAKGVALAVANSVLVKTALHGEDANWGRIMAAIGRSGVAIDPQAVDISFDKVRLVKSGISTGPAREALANRVLKNDSFTITINLNRGAFEETIYTCDLSPDYVKLNARYRT